MLKFLFLNIPSFLCGVAIGVGSTLIRQNEDAKMIAIGVVSIASLLIICIFLRKLYKAGFNKGLQQSKNNLNTLNADRMKEQPNTSTASVNINLNKPQEPVNNLDKYIVEK